MEKRIKDIYRYWDNNAKQYGMSHEVSWGDINMISLETETISHYIKNKDKVLDAGCANGFSTLRYLKRRPSLIRGFDYSPAMIRAAENKLKKIRTAIPVHFYQADIRNIPERTSFFDVSITTRVLINLPSWKLQKQAMDEVARVTRKGGLILFSEAFTRGLKKINELRKIFMLPPLTAPAFNKYLDEGLMKEYLRKKGLKYEIINFSSIYYIGSRVLREMYMEMGEKASYKHFINDFFLEMEKKKDKLDFGIQKLFVVKKSY